MKFVRFSILVTVFILGCQPKEALTQDPFKTLDAEELFFKNVRLSDYQVIENKAAGMNIYTHQSFTNEEDLILKLVQNWRDDQAYVMIDWPSGEGETTLFSANDSITWSGASMLNHLRTAQFIFDHSLNNDDIYMGSKNAVALKIPDHFIITMKDFKKLTSKK